MDRIYRIDRIFVLKLVMQERASVSVKAYKAVSRRAAENAEKTTPPHRKLLRSLLPGIKVNFDPDTQDLIADFEEIPLPGGEVR